MFISSIQVFWFVAVDVADSTATSPPSGSSSAASLMIMLPISACEDGSRCISRPSGATPNPSEITVMPRCIAFFSAGTSASGSLAEIAMASTCWAISELMTSIWPSAVVSVGPV